MEIPQEHPKKESPEAPQAESVPAKLGYKQISEYQVMESTFNGLPRNDSSLPFALWKLNKGKIDIFNQLGVTPSIVRTSEIFYKNTRGNWKKDTSNSEIVELIAAETALQSAILNAPDEPSLILAITGNHSRKSQESLLQKTEGSLYKSDGVTTRHYLVTDESALLAASQLASANALRNTDAVLARFRERNKEVLTTRTDGASVEKNTSQVDIQEAKEDKPATDLPAPIDFIDDDTKYQIVKTMSAAERNKEPKIREGDSDIDEVIKSTDTTPDAPLLEESSKTFSSSEEATKIFTASVEKGNENVERVENKLLERSKNVGERLKRLGLKGLTGTLEGFGKLEPRTRLAIGVGLAGASVIFGGGVGAAAFLVSSLSFASNVYKKNLAKIENKGDTLDEEKKHKAAVRAAVFGTILAAGSYLTFQEVFKLADIAGHMISDKASTLIDSAKEYVENLTSHNAPATLADVAVPDVTQPSTVVTGVDPSPATLPSASSPIEQVVPATSETVIQSPVEQVPVPVEERLSIDEIIQRQHDKVLEIVKQAAGA